MGMYSDWKNRNTGTDSEKQIANVEFVLKALDKLIPPVGYIYMSTSSANPDTIYPGTTWVAWGSGRVPVGINTGETEFNTVEKTGGEKSHRLSIGEIPSHSHIYTAPAYGSNHRFFTTTGNVTQLQREETRTTGPAGSSGVHNNLQPYITCYMWKRSA